MIEEKKEENKLLKKVREGIVSSKFSDEPTPVKTEEEAREEISKVLIELKQKMKEIDRITVELNRKREELSKNSPKRTTKLLEEIKVPPLEMLK